METTKITRKQAQTTLKAVKMAGQTINQALKAFNGGLAKADGYDGEEIWKQATSVNGCTVADIMQAMGLAIDSGDGLTFTNLKAFWTLNVGGIWAVYTNVPVLTEAGQRVYVEKKDGEMKPLSVRALRAVGKNEWTVATICKGIEQNWLPETEAKRAAANVEKAKKHSAYYIKGEEGYEVVKIENIVF